MTATSHTTADTRPTTPDLAIDLARFASGVDATTLDDAVIEAAKTNILDTLSCALAGSSAKAIGDGLQPGPGIGGHAASGHVCLRRQVSGAPCGLDQRRYVTCTRVARDSGIGRLRGRTRGLRGKAATQIHRRRPVGPVISVADHLQRITRRPVPEPFERLHERLPR